MQVYVAHAGNMDADENFLLAFRGPEHVEFERNHEFFADDGAKVGRLLAWLTAEIWGDSFIKAYMQARAELNADQYEDFADFLGEPAPTAQLEIRTHCVSSVDEVEVKSL